MSRCSMLGDIRNGSGIDQLRGIQAARSEKQVSIGAGRRLIGIFPAALLGEE